MNKHDSLDQYVKKWKKEKGRKRREERMDESEDE
ncbi:hypothetical protein GGP44_000143 [Salinibacter ruber]|jgi:hypothetical protein|nr:hypothetical protein [Salinibacter ruber]